MKYLHHILQNMVPEWVKLYLNYKLLKTYLSISSQLKKMLVFAKKTKTLVEYKMIKQSIISTFVLMDKLQYDNKCFIQLFADETAKVEAFVLWKHSDLKMKISKLQAQVKAMRLSKEDLEIRFASWKKQQKRRSEPLIIIDQDGPDQERIDYDQIERDFDDLKMNKRELLETFYRFYNETVHFQSYVEINHEAIRKILKKYRKQMIKGIRQKRDEKESFGNIIERMQLSSVSVKVKSLIIDIEQLMIQNFYSSKPNLCKENLRKYGEIISVQKKILFWFGFFAGFTFVFIILLLVLRSDGNVDVHEQQILNNVFPIYRGTGLLLLYFWFLALDVYGWNYFRINYKIYLGFNHHFSTLPEILERVIWLSSIYLVSLLFYCIQLQETSYFFKIDTLNPNIFPIIPWIALGFFAFVPTKRAFNGQGKQWMSRMFWGAFFGHFIKYESRFTFFSEQLISMIIPLMDLEYTFCYYYEFFRTGSNNNNCYYQERYSSLLICFIPYLVISCQYLTRARDKGSFYKTNEMWNFIKNMLSMQLGILSFISLKVNFVKWIWVLFAVVCAFYQYFWDLRKDWLFFQPNARYKFLRNDLGYNQPCIYYVMVILNIFLRIVWTFSVSPNIYFAFDISHVQVLILIVGILELCRRLICNFLKIEKEHITNQKLFKTVMDYKYPFDLSSKIHIQEYDDEDNKNTHWSISTMNRYIDSEEDESSTERRKKNVRASQTELVGSVVPLIDEKEKLRSSLEHVGVQSKTKSLEEQFHNKTVSDGKKEQFELSPGASKKSEQLVQKKRSEDCKENQPQHVIWDILNKANNQEAFQQHKTAQIQEDNKKYKILISDLYEKFQLSQK